MLKKDKIMLCLAVLFLLGISSWISGQEKDRPWIYSLLDAVRSPYQVKDTSGFLKFGLDNETQLRIIHNINNHLEEMEKLQTSGLSVNKFCTGLDAEQAAPGSGSISGNVRLKGKPKSSFFYIYVRAYNEYGYYSGSRYILSSGDGNYIITGLLPGKYYLWAQASGYDGKYYRNTDDWKKAKLIPVKEFKDTSGINFVLESSEEKGKSAISGRVKGEDGTALRDCYIYAYGEDYSYSSGNYAKTDENGLYKIEGLHSGKYRLHCSYSGSANFVDEWYKNEQSYESASLVKVIEPKTRTGINFILEYGGNIGGKVICASGKKAGANQAYVYAYNEAREIVASGRTDEDGKFIISKLIQGSYRLYTSYNGPENNLDSWYRKAEHFEKAVPVHIAPQRTKNVRIKLKPGGAVSGKVIDYNGSPVSENCYIKIYDENKYYRGYTWTDANGNYMMMKLHSGRYKLLAEYNDYDSYSFSPEPMDEWYDGVFDYDDADFVRVREKKTTSNINFSLDQGGSIGGTVYCIEGHPAFPDGVVRVYNDRGNYVDSCDVTYNGQYFISGLHSGDYKIMVYHPDYVSEWYGKSQNFEMAETVKVTSPNHTPGINFILNYPGFFKGFLTDNIGHRLYDDNYNIYLFIFDADKDEYVTTVYNTFTGGYQCGLSGGNYKLAAVSVYSNGQPSQDFLARTFYLNGQSYSDPNSQSLNLVPKEVRKLDDLKMSRVNGSIIGMIYDKNTNLPLKDAAYLLFAYDEDGYLAKISTYMDDSYPITGKYKLAGLRPGNYYVFLALLIDDEIFLFFYPDVICGENFISVTPKVEIPFNAQAVVVGEGETKGIDFYVKRTIKEDK